MILNHLKISKINKIVKIKIVLRLNCIMVTNSPPLIHLGNKLNYDIGIKQLKNGKYQENWHFIDQPYLDQGGKISDFNFTFDTHNVTAIMHDIVDFINHNDGYNQSFTYS